MISLFHWIFQMPIFMWMWPRSHRHFVCFKFEGKIFQFKAMFFGLSSALQLFTKLTHAVSGYCCQMGIKIANFALLRIGYCSLGLVMSLGDVSSSQIGFHHQSLWGLGSWKILWWKPLTGLLPTLFMLSMLSYCQQRLWFLSQPLLQFRMLSFLDIPLFLCYRFPWLAICAEPFEILFSSLRVLLPVAV